MSSFPKSNREPEIVYRRSREEAVEVQPRICVVCNGVIDSVGRCAPACPSARNLLARSTPRVPRSG